MRVIRGKKALITGAASGIGRAIALGLAREGADVCLLDVDEEALRPVAVEARQSGVEAIEIRCDVTCAAEITTSIQSLLSEWGHVDILVNNAGVAYYGPTVNMTAEQWDWLMAINVHAPIQFTRELLPTMLSRPEGHIVNVASICGLVAGGRFVAYHVSKFALVGLSEALRAEFARAGLGVTALCPGPVWTNLYRAAACGHEHRTAPTPPRWLCVTPERVAAKAIKGIYRNKPLVLVTALAYLLYYLKRFVPGFLDALHHIGRRRKMKKKAAELQMRKAA